MPAAALQSPILDEDDEPAARAVPADSTLSVRVLPTLNAAEPIWRALETDALLTPYQRYDWISHLVAAGMVDKKLAIVVIEADGEPVALLPLGIDTRLGARRAEIIGADIGNGDWMIIKPAAAPRLTRSRLQKLLSEAGRIAGIDLIALYGQPGSWAGIDNPLLAFPHQPSPDHYYFGTLGKNGRFDRLDEQRLANLLRRKRKLGQAVGDVVLRRADSVEDIDKIHRAFIELRAARFAQMGIRNIFAEPHFVRFFRDTAIASLGQPQPTLVFHALYAGDGIIATACGGYGGRHYTQYINATAGGDIAKFRLIGILMHELFLDVAKSGGTSIDMGLGDFDYKGDWTSAQTVYDGIIPLTLRCRAAGAAILSARRVKRAIKQHDRLWALVRKVRAALGGRKVQLPPSD
jgi:CelD/BcsL family acetyltransferase involved in cellulose biosynthesis